MIALFLMAVQAGTATVLPQKGEPPLSAQTQLSGGVRPAEQLALAFRHADLAFDMDPAARRLAGKATLTFEATAAVDRIVVDLDANFVVSGVTVDGTSARFERPDGRLIVLHPLAKGARAIVAIGYAGTPHVALNAPWDDGMVWSQTPDGRPWFASTTEGYGCDILWPCLDFPTGEPDAATLHITVPAGLKAPSNGRLLRVEPLPDGRSIWHWQARQPNTYAIAINVGPHEEMTGSYRSRFGNSIALHYWYLPGPGAKEKAAGLFAEFAPTLDFFEGTIGPYPFGDEKVGVVETPHKGMEHQTINAYGNDYAKAPEGFDWLFQHEFAHEWFANQLTAANWDDYWLHEGFATYMQPLYGRWREGEARYAVMLDAERSQIADRAPIVRDKVLTEEEVYEPAKGGAGNDIYYKGSWTLHTLRGLIGDTAFFRATRRLVYGRADPRPGNFRPRFASTKEFEAIVAQEAGRDLSWFFDAYLRRSATPDLVATRRGGRLELQWRAGDRAFPLPVEVAVDGRVTTVPMTNGRGSIVAREGAHVVIDPAARVLRRSIALEDYRRWKAAQGTTVMNR